MLARYYGDKVPRFLSPDPIGGSAALPQSWNRYAYVLGNPMKLVDPTGMYWAPGTPKPSLPGDPNGCTMCVVAPDGGDSYNKKVDRRIERLEKDPEIGPRIAEMKRSPHWLLAII